MPCAKATMRKGPIGIPSVTNSHPMSERQQMALLLKMTSQEEPRHPGRPTCHNTLYDRNIPNPHMSNSFNETDSDNPGESKEQQHQCDKLNKQNIRGETMLHRAAIKGDVRRVLGLISLGANVNAEDFAGWTPLHEACNYGRYDVAKSLICAGADVNVKSSAERFTPLHDAAAAGYYRIVRLLLRAGADPDQPNHRGFRPRDITRSPDVIKEFDDFQNRFLNVDSPDEGCCWSPLASPDSTNSTQFVFADVEHTDSTSDEDCNSDYSSTKVVSDYDSPSDPHRHRHTDRPKLSLPRSRTPTTTEDDFLPPPVLSPCVTLDNKGQFTHFGDRSMRKAPPNNKVSVEKPGSPRLTLRLHQVKGTNNSSREHERNKLLATSHNLPVLSKATDSNLEISRVQYSIAMELPNPKEDSSNGASVPQSKDSVAKSNTPSPVTWDGQQSWSPKNRDGGSPSQPSSTDSKKVTSADSAVNKDGNNGGIRECGSPPKRQFSEVSDGADNDDEDETKRKKRKETGRVGNGTQKSKTAKNVNSPNTSAANSPKGFQLPKLSDAENSDNEDSKKSWESGGSGGPKVPPLKIVIPQQNEQEQGGNRSGKNGNGRTQAALPYVVTSASSDSSTDNTVTNTTACPTNPVTTENITSVKVGDDKGSGSGSEPEKQHRVTRSTHRIATSHHGSPATSDSDRSEGGGTPSNINVTRVSSGGDNTDKGSSIESEHQSVVDLHPRKRKIRPKDVDTGNGSEVNAHNTNPPGPHPHDQPVVNCYEMYLNIRRQIERRRKNLFPVQPKPPQGFKDYLMNRCSYVLAGNAASRLSFPMISPPPSLPPAMKEAFTDQEKERYKLRMQHLIEKEKLVLAVEQEILRVHGRAARALANQALPFSVCTILKDAEVYNLLTPEQEEKDRNARSRYNGRLFLSWLQDVDDKWEKIKESMLLRHHNEAESLHAVQRMDWEWKLKDLSLCEPKAEPQIDELHVPMVHVSDDFDLLPT